MNRFSVRSDHIMHILVYKKLIAQTLFDGHFAIHDGHEEVGAWQHGVDVAKGHDGCRLSL